MAFDDTLGHPALTASELDFSFWPRAATMASQIMLQCVGQTHGRIWGGSATNTIQVGGVFFRYKVMVEGWIYNVYTRSGRLEM